MKLAITLSVLLAALPAGAQIQIPRPAPAAAEEESPSKPRELNVRAMRVNRCIDAKGGITLQDAACTPVPATAASAAADVIELSAMAPRVRAEGPSATAEDTSTSRLTKGLINGAWKLGLLVLVCYGLFRLAKVVRDRYLDRQPPVDTGIRGPRRAR